MPRKRAKRKRRKQTRHRKPPTLEERAAVERLAHTKSEPPAVSIVKIERDELLNPEAGHGIVIYCTTSFRVTDAEIRRAFGRGWRCFLCKDESWLK